MKYLLSALLGVTMWNSDDEKISRLGTAVAGASIGAYLLKDG